VSLILLSGTDTTAPACGWLVCLLLLVGILAQSGGMFLHASWARPAPGRPGNTVTVAGRRRSPPRSSFLAVA